MLLSQLPLTFYCTIYNYLHIECDGPRDYLRGVPWEDIFKLGSSTAIFECHELSRLELM